MVCMYVQVMKPHTGRKKPEPASQSRLPNPERDDNVPRETPRHDRTSQEESDKEKHHGKLSDTDACKIEWSDALSALKRAKTEECKQEIRRVTCLAQKNSLYTMDVGRSCPLESADVGAQEPPHHVPVHPTVPKEDVRIVFVFVVHGRAFRQFRRVFKAVYHSRHYFYIHVDSVSEPPIPCV